MSSNKIMLIRHAEKPTNSANGITAAGVQNSEELIVQGWQRSGALVRFFDPRSSVIASGISKPDQIYAAKPNDNSQSLRSEHTVLALAQTMQLSIQAQYGQGDETALAQKLVTLSGHTLVAWHHEDIPTIVNNITGNQTTCPQSWPDDRFDMVWVLEGSSSHGWSFSQAPQMLLPGDSTDPIPFD